MVPSPMRCLLCNAEMTLISAVNELASALISMMVRSTTLQSKAGYIDGKTAHHHPVEIFLLRTAGPYIGSQADIQITAG